jgi:hypothetical protein
MASLAAGEIRVTWSLPLHEGGDPVKGYLIYLNEVLFLDQRTKSTLNEYTFTGLSVGQLYKIRISAVNDIGEGTAAEISELAASVPMKLNVPSLVSSTKDSITIEAPHASFDGGDAVKEYVFRRDDGPATAFQAQQTDHTQQYTFANLATARFYRFQVAAVNSIGQGAWSEHVGFFAASQPGMVTDLRATLQSESQITIEWSEPSKDEDGGCSIGGYRAYLEDIEDPGYTIVYNGVKQPSVLKFTLT